MSLVFLFQLSVFVNLVSCSLVLDHQSCAGVTMIPCVAEKMWYCMKYTACSANYKQRFQMVGGAEITANLVQSLTITLYRYQLAAELSKEHRVTYSVAESRRSASTSTCWRRLESKQQWTQSQYNRVLH